MSEERLSAELRNALDDGGFLKLVETYGGIRLYVPSQLARDHFSELASVLGDNLADRLALRYGGMYIRVPLAREFRALHYRAEGWSNPRIARKLGLTETGVDKLFRRRRDDLSDEDQIDLFAPEKPARPPRRA